MATLLIYYWFSAPILAQTASTLSGHELPEWTVNAVLAVIAVLAGSVLFNGLKAEREFARIKAAQPKVGVKTATIRAAGAAGADSDLVVERSSGRSFAAEPTRTILEGIESIGLTMDFGCRMGVC